MIYCVVYVASNSVAYVGPNLEAAAEALNPGTCYAKAEDAVEAERRAFLEAARIRREQREGAAA